MTARQALLAEFQALVAAHTAALFAGKRFADADSFTRMVFLGKLLK